MKSRFAAAFFASALAIMPLGAMAQYMDINTIVSGIGSPQFMHDAAEVDDASGVSVVRLSTLAGADKSAGRVADIVARKSHVIDYLHGNLIINPFAVRAIRNAGLSLDQIVSLDLMSDGAAVLYADDL